MKNEVNNVLLKIFFVVEDCQGLEVNNSKGIKNWKFYLKKAQSFDRTQIKTLSNSWPKILNWFLWKKIGKHEILKLKYDFIYNKRFMSEKKLFYFAFNKYMRYENCMNCIKNLNK